MVYWLPCLSALALREVRHRQPDKDAGGLLTLSRHRKAIGISITTLPPPQELYRRVEATIPLDANRGFPMQCSAMPDFLQA